MTDEKTDAEIVEMDKEEIEVDKEIEKEIKTEPEVEKKQEERPRGHRPHGRGRPREEPKEWIPKTRLGQEVLKGKYKTIDDLLKAGELILEPGIVDHLVPDLSEEIIYIGGSPGKGGGIRRTATKRTVRMHKSGRRFKLTALIVIGNKDGVVGMARASSQEHRVALEKAIEQAKLNVIRVRRSCGSWECGCGEGHSIPFKTEGKYGSVRVVLLPAPRGTGLVANEPVKKVLGLAGLNDVWVKTYGQTDTRSNLVFAVFDALKNLNTTKGDL